jgi:putative tryptophan/tyrosine transport system substrate-binding protein
MMKRRAFISLLGGAAAWPFALRAQQQPAMPVIGFLGGSSLADRRPLLTGFRQALTEAGYVEGQNVAIEYRWAEGEYDRLPALAAELARRQITVLVAGDGPSALAAKAATTTIPIVFNTGIEPVQAGLVTSLSRPGGNLTGVNLIAGPLPAKQLGLLHELVPAAKVLAVLINPNNANAERDAATVEDAARAVGLHIVVTRAAFENDFETVFATVARERAGGLLVNSDVFFTSRRDQIVALAGSPCAPRHGCMARIPPGWQPDQLRTQHCRRVSSNRRLYWQGSQRRQAGRPPGRSAHHVRVGDQPQDRQDAGPPNSRQATRRRRRGD